MCYKLTWLFAQIAYPVRLDLSLVVFLLLCLSLLINFVICKCLQTFILIALEFQIRICYNDTFSRNKVNQRTWNQVVRELNLENLYVVTNKKEGTVHTLYTNSGLARTNSNREVKKVALKFMTIDLFIHTVTILVYHT